MSNRSKAGGYDSEWHDDPLAQVAASPSPAQALPAPATAPAPLRTLAAARPPAALAAVAVAVVAAPPAAPVTRQRPAWPSALAQPGSPPARGSPGLAGLPGIQPLFFAIARRCRGGVIGDYASLAVLLGVLAALLLLHVVRYHWLFEVGRELVIRLPEEKQLRLRK